MCRTSLLLRQRRPCCDCVGYVVQLFSGSVDVESRDVFFFFEVRDTSVTRDSRSTGGSGFGLSRCAVCVGSSFLEA